jgi:hypothetical protein
MVSRHLTTLFALTAVLAVPPGLTACGGGEDSAAPAPAPAPPPPPPPPSGSGPAPNLTQLAKICPVATPSANGTNYTQCKASTDAQANLDVFGAVNAWLVANSNVPVPPAGAGLVTLADPALKAMASDGSLKALAVGDDCGFALEPGLGLWLANYQKATLSASPAVAFAGLASDEIDVDKDGLVTYMHAGDFSLATGGMEVNFPGVTNGSLIEHVWGQSYKIALCHLKE